MKKILLGLVSIALMMCLTGCGVTYPELSEDAIVFNFESFEYEDEGFGSIEYNGRKYIMYGTTSGVFDIDELDKCIGYIEMDEIRSDNETRVFTLESDPDENFLYERYIATTWMNPPTFYRAIDTKDKDINIPNYIDDFGYEYWK